MNIETEIRELWKRAHRLESELLDSGGVSHGALLGRVAALEQEIQELRHEMYPANTTPAGEVCGTEHGNGECLGRLLRDDAPWHVGDTFLVGHTRLTIIAVVADGLGISEDGGRFTVHHCDVHDRRRPPLRKGEWVWYRDEPWQVCKSVGAGLRLYRDVVSMDIPDDWKTSCTRIIPPKENI